MGVQHDTTHKLITTKPHPTPLRMPTIKKEHKTIATTKVTNGIVKCKGTAFLQSTEIYKLSEVNITYKKITKIIHQSSHRIIQIKTEHQPHTVLRLHIFSVALSEHGTLWGLTYNLALQDRVQTDHQFHTQQGEYFSF